MSCTSLITGGVAKDCAAVNAPTGVQKDLILVNYDEFDYPATSASGNIETDDTNGNEGGLTAISLLAGATQYTFEGTDYSVMPSSPSEVREDGDAWFLHQIAFMVYSKSSVTRNILKELSNSKVVAIVIDRSTGFWELFGMEHGLKVTEMTREYVGNQNANFYGVTIATPDIAAVRESALPQLSHQAPVTAA